MLMILGWFCLFSVSSRFQVVPTRHKNYVVSIWLTERSECAMLICTTSDFTFSTVLAAALTLNSLLCLSFREALYILEGTVLCHQQCNGCVAYDEPGFVIVASLKDVSDHGQSLHEIFYLAAGV